MKIALPLLVCLSVGCFGCSRNDGPPMYDVEGHVTFDGKNLNEGRILFRQLEQDKKAYSAQVKNGYYKLQTKEGPMSVQITASRIVPGKFDNTNGMNEQVGEMYIPHRYNDKTELTATVTADGANDFDFELKSK